MNTKILLSLVGLGLMATAAQAQTHIHWTGGYGSGTTDWFTPGNWEPNVVPGYDRSPRIGVHAFYYPTIWPDYNGDNSTNAPTRLFLISTAMDAWFTNSGGRFVISNNNVQVGNGNGFTGTFIQKGGDFTVVNGGFRLGTAAGATGVLEMSDGNIRFVTTVNYIGLDIGYGVGSTGIMTMFGGTISNGLWLTVGSGAGATATMNQYGGVIFTTNIYLPWGSGCQGTLTITNGKLYVAHNVTLSVVDSNSVGTLNVIGGDLVIGQNLFLGLAVGSTNRLVVGKNATVWAGWTMTLNNPSRSANEVTVTIEEGGTLDVDRIEFWKSSVTIATNGLLKARNAGGDAMPVSLREQSVVDLRGGQFWIRGDLTYTGLGHVPAYIEAGRLITSLPDHLVAFRYDAADGYTKIWAAGIRDWPLSIHRSQNGLAVTLSWPRWADPTGTVTIQVADLVEGPFSDAWFFPSPTLNGNNWSVTVLIDPVAEQQYFRCVKP